MLRLCSSLQPLRRLKTLPVLKTAMTAPKPIAPTAEIVTGRETKTASGGTAVVTDVAREMSMGMKT